MTREEALLIKRTVWRNEQPKAFKPPKPDDKLYVNKAVKMLSALACLNSVMFDLEEELVEHNLFRQSLKKSVRSAQKNVAEVYNFAFIIMRDANEGAALSITVFHIKFTTISILPQFIRFVNNYFANHSAHFLHGVSPAATASSIVVSKLFLPPQSGSK